ESFLAIQKMALCLRNRGVVLAVCSKNDEDIARAPFLSHSEMVLKSNHIAVFQANWSDKASNLRKIADTLNIDLSSLVLLDDNPAERAQVRRELPMVAVPELPPHPAFYPRALLATGYFDVASFSEEDRKRANYYGANAQRASLKVETGDLTEYLCSLTMICKIRPFALHAGPGLAQLINKTEQFEFTPQRCPALQAAQVRAELR